MIREAMEWLVNSVRPPAVDVKGAIFKVSDRDMAPLLPIYDKPLELHSIESLLSYMEEYPDSFGFDPSDALQDHLTFVIVNAQMVDLVGDAHKVNGHTIRPTYARVTYDAQAILPLGKYMELEEFIVRAQLQFDAVDGNSTIEYEAPEISDYAALMKVVGNVREGSVTKWNDDGVTQQVTIKNGLASMAAVPIKNPFHLSSHCTFTEVGSLSFPYLLRMKGQDGDQPLVALFDLDEASKKATIRTRISRYIRSRTKVPVIM